MNKTLKHIHKLLTQGNCPSKLLLAFKNSATLDEAKDEEVTAKRVHPDSSCKSKSIIDKNGWVG